MTLNHVTLVKVGSSWGSGVILGQGEGHDEGLVLTCSHVVKDNQAHTVKLKIRPKSPLMDCRILHQTNRGVQFDLAVLACKGLSSHKSYLPLAYPKEGVTVYVVGHATFGDDLDLHPSVTSGVVSRVITVNNIPVMIQTTCAVHPGTSGGALVDEDNHLMGIVVSNAKDTSTGACYPHVNMCVPMVTIWPVLMTYLKTKDPNVLRFLNLRNAAIDALWTLGKESSGTDSTQIASRL